MANENRLIDANAFEEKLKKFIGGTSIGFVLVGALRNEPTVDAVEVVHGEWVQIGYDKAMDRITCSNCKEYWNICDNDTETFNYCPNCGAKMDGEGKANETD